MSPNRHWFRVRPDAWAWRPQAEWAAQACGEPLGGIAAAGLAGWFK